MVDDAYDTYMTYMIFKWYLYDSYIISIVFFLFTNQQSSLGPHIVVAVCYQYGNAKKTPELQEATKKCTWTPQATWKCSVINRHNSGSLASKSWDITP